METAGPRHRAGHGTGEELRDMRTDAALERLGRELRHAARRLVRSPAFTLATVLTLALAIGANASIFAVVHRVLLNPLPYDASDRLIQLEYGRRNAPLAISTITSRLFYQNVDRARTLESLGAVRLGRADPDWGRRSRTDPRGSHHALARAGAARDGGPGPLVHRCGSRARRVAGGCVIARAVGAALRRGPGNARPDDHARRRADEGDRRDEALLSVSGSTV
jgi:hypothetical protein